MNDKAKYWIELADYDIDTAKVMLIGKRYLYVGFMCHQAIEKALKAAIANLNEETVPPKTHDLVKLAKNCNLYSLICESQKDILDILLPLNIEARYPSYKEMLLKQLSDSTCENILAETEGILLWIKQQL